MILKGAVLECFKKGGKKFFFFLLSFQGNMYSSFQISEKSLSDNSQ